MLMGAIYASAMAAGVLVDDVAYNKYHSVNFIALLFCAGNQSPGKKNCISCFAA